MDLYWYYVIGACISGVIFGLLTRSINTGKGYDGGFFWGFFLGLIGLIIVCVRPKKEYIAPVRTQQDEMMANQQILMSGGWQCARCGKPNYAHTGSCGCGMTKQESMEMWQKVAQQMQAQQQQYSQQQYPQQQQYQQPIYQPQQGYDPNAGYYQQ